MSPYRCIIHAGRCACLSALAAAPLRAQVPSVQDEIQKIREEMRAMRESYETRIRALEERLQDQPIPVEQDPLDQALADLEQALEEDPAKVQGDLGQTTRFDNKFNPAFGAVIDFSLSVSDLDESFDEFNQFRLRTLELDAAAEIDPYTWAYVVLEFGPEEAGVAEAAMTMSLNRFLPESELTIKGGRFFLDLDPLNPIHEHDFPFVHQPAVKVAFFGGNVVGNGLELHHWFPIGDVPVRWSLGMASDVAGETETEFGGEEEEEGVPGMGRRDFENFAYTARVAADFEVSDLDQLVLGGSVLYAPEVRSFQANAAPPPDVLRFDSRQLTGELDVTWKRTESTGDGFTFSTAYFVNDGEFTDETTLETFDETAHGLYSYFDYRIDHEWSAGVVLDWAQEITDNDVSVHQYAVYLTWRASTWNRWRLQLQRTEADVTDESRFPGDFWVAWLQWTVNLGVHAHGVDW